VPIVATVTVKMPLALVGRDAPQSLEVQGATVGEALRDCVAKQPRLESRIFRADGNVWVGIILNGRSIFSGAGLDEPVTDGDEIKLMPPVAGG
jgi:sulfur-carrier protein